MSSLGFDSSGRYGLDEEDDRYDTDTCLDDAPTPLSIQGNSPDAKSDKSVSSSCTPCGVYISLPRSLQRGLEVMEASNEREDPAGMPSSETAVGFKCQGEFPRHDKILTKQCLHVLESLHGLATEAFVREQTRMDSQAPGPVEITSTPRPPKRSLASEEDEPDLPSSKRFRLECAGVLAGAIAGSLATYASLAFVEL